MPQNLHGYINNNPSQYCQQFFLSSPILLYKDSGNLIKILYLRWIKLSKH